MTIGELTELIKDVVEFESGIYNISKSDGMPQKPLNVELVGWLGWVKG